ncbi:hypothetical protein PCE1_001362 [Barthelona sp. PCE]
MDYSIFKKFIYDNIELPSVDELPYLDELDESSELEEPKVIDVDVLRSFSHFLKANPHMFPTSEEGRENLREDFRLKLRKILTAILHDDELNVFYYQGLHEMISILLLLTNGDVTMSYQIIVAMCRKHINFFVTKEPALETVDPLVKIIRVAWPSLKVGEDFDTELFLCTIPWVLTWFSYNYENLEILRDIFIFCLKDEMNIYYLCASMFMRGLFTQYEGSDPLDQAKMHTIFNRREFIKEGPFAEQEYFDDVMEFANDLLEQHPWATVEKRVALLDNSVYQAVVNNKTAIVIGGAVALGAVLYSVMKQ